MQIDHSFTFKIKILQIVTHRNIKSFVDSINKASISDLSKIFIMKMKYIENFVSFK